MLADHCEYGRANVLAQNLLSMLYDREFEPCDYLPPSTRSMETEVVKGISICSIGNVFPNPCTSELFLPMHCKGASEIEIRILDITGRMLQSEIRDLEGGICKINTQKLVPGAYQVCVIFNDGSQKSRKFVKQN